MSQEQHNPASESPPDAGKTGDSSQLPVESGADEKTKGESYEPQGQSTEAPAEG